MCVLYIGVRASRTGATRGFTHRRDITGHFGALYSGGIGRGCYAGSTGSSALWEALGRYS